ncbi:MAG: hypothetical protein LQ342_002850 [Letrouitia transgressa]|nr:MAG: hypothetical protein LQ342_002850 [Letrouitia transgressa]
MTELLAKLIELKSLPSGLHWFCSRYDAPRQRPIDPTHEDDKPVKAEDSITDDVEYRRALVNESLQLFGYEDSADLVPYKDYLTRQIDRQLGKCDICILEYYKSKRRMIEELRHDNDEEEVNQFSRILDRQDFARISRGLDRTASTLSEIDASKRTKDVLRPAEQFALFEALSNEAFLNDDELCENYFNKSFALVQTYKHLRVGHYVPAMTKFLFDPDPSKCAWAQFAWSRLRKLLTKDDFEFAVRGPLFRQVNLIPELGAEASFSQRLWTGMEQIVDKLNNDLVTHSLQAMEIDVPKLALNHLLFNSPGFHPLLQTIEKLLQIAPQDFWNSMDVVSPTTVIEQIFNNPQYDNLLLKATEQADYDTSVLKDMLSWVEPFMASLKTVHQAQACRSLTFQFMDRLQAERFPTQTRTECFRTGLGVLNWALSHSTKDDSSLGQIGRVVAAEILGIVSNYIQRILNVFSLSREDPFRMLTREACMRAVKVSLALECKSLRADQETLKEEKELHSGFCSYSPAIWVAVVNHLDRGNFDLARAALAGISDLTGLEKFTTNSDKIYQKEKSDFNTTFGHLTHLICQMLERINDFDPSDLDTLFRHPETATALVASLFSPDANTYEAGVNLMKSISSEGARKEAIRHLLLPFFGTTINGFSWSIRRIAHNRTYASCPRMLKTSTDVLDILCDSQDGLLRTRPLTDNFDVEAVESFWCHQWDVLRVIYEMTEEWGRTKVSDTATLKEFCRDTMQFSDRLFDQFSTFASSLDSAPVIKHGEGDDEAKYLRAGQRLLAHPGKTMDSMVKWLRLRDPYLASTSVRLTIKLLDRMSEAGMRLAKTAGKFLGYVIRGDPQGRTHLTVAEKAELARATEKNLGHAIVTLGNENPPSDSSRASSVSLAADTRKKRATTIDIDKWKAKAKSSLLSDGVINNEEFGDSNLEDEDMQTFAKTFDLRGQQAYKNSSLAAINHERAKGLKVPSKSVKTGKLGPQADADRALFREKREKEKEAKRRRDAEALAKIKKNVPNRSTTISGEGSGLSGIGIKGKDHAPKEAGMMVETDSESSDSDDEMENELFGTSFKEPKMVDVTGEDHGHKPQPKIQQGPVKKTRRARSAKDMRARLAPDLVSLHKTILGWDFFHNGEFPPASSRDDYSLVTSKFRSPLDYQNTFEPLLLLESWQSFIQSKEEGTLKPFEIKIANRMAIDSFIEISTAMPLSEGQELGISEADIILLSKARSPAAEPQEPHCLARVNRMTRKKGSMEISYRLVPGGPLVSFMVPNATIRGVKIFSMTPLEREYGALLGLKYFDLCDEIIKAKPSPHLKYRDEHILPLMTNYKVNNAQAKAIRSAVDNDAFTLIQGPPGSGKTKTIVAIVGALLSGTFVDKAIAITRPSSAEDVRRPAPSASKKLLVCAPSNAAVDELVMRFKDGIKTVSGEAQKLSIIRLGRSDAINSNVKDVTLDELVNAKINLASDKKTNTGEDIHQLMMMHKDTCEKLNVLRAELEKQNGQGQTASPEQERDIESFKRKKQQLSTKIDQTRDSGDIIARDAEINRRQIQQGILDSAHIICATLSGSGHEMFQNLNIEFETVIIDEAAQSIELSALIPLKYGCSKCILVGDPKQLPPTVLSREAARFQYEQSLFVRMQSNYPHDVHLLDTQYRMHPEISSFPSSAFYEGRLLDGESMLSLRTKPWHQSSLLSPYRFFDVLGSHQSAPRGHSLINIAEIEVALALYDRLVTDYRGYDFKNKIGVITPYKSQLRLLKERYAQNYGRSVLETVEFNTTDAFQGRESEVIIFSCVRASPSGGIGFLSDIRRMNVGITRAKSSLWVLGNSQSLMNGEYWSKLVQDARNRDRFTAGDIVGMLARPLIEMKPIPASNAESTGVSDIEMMEAPTNEPSTTSSSRRSSTSQGPRPLYQPSGGANGLNPLKFCGRCGSAAHQTHLCDNVFAREIGGEKCHRCGESDHRKHECTIERCLECGEFGHASKFCFSSKPLSKNEKMQLAKSEEAHKRYVSSRPERMRRKQVKENMVPIVRTTKKTPPPVEGRQGQTRLDTAIRQQANRSPTNVPRGSNPAPRNGGIPGRPSTLGISSDGGSNHAISQPVANPPQISRSSNEARTGQSVSNPISKSPGTHREKNPTIGQPSAPQHPARPTIKKRKEADPFIRPKDKRQRR